MSKTKRSIGLALWVAIIALNAGEISLRAHGIGTPQVLNAPAGPYLFSAWTDPDPLRVDETHVVMAVIDPETREIIVAGIEASISLISMDDPAIVYTEVAGSDNVNQLLFAAEFNNQLTEGVWRVAISATGERGPSDEITFDIEVRPARGFYWLWIGVGGLAAILLIWVAGAMRSERPARRPRRSRRRPSN